MVIALSNNSSAANRHLEAVAHGSPRDNMAERAALDAQRGEVLVKIKELP